MNIKLLKSFYHEELVPEKTESILKIKHILTPKSIASIFIEPEDESRADKIENALNNVGILNFVNPIVDYIDKNGALFYEELFVSLVYGLEGEKSLEKFADSDLYAGSALVRKLKFLRGVGSGGVGAFYSKSDYVIKEPLTNDSLVLFRVKENVHAYVKSYFEFKLGKKPDFKVESQSTTQNEKYFWQKHMENE